MWVDPPSVDVSPSLLTRPQQQCFPSPHFTIPFPPPLVCSSTLQPSFSISNSIVAPKTLSFVYQPGVGLYDKKLAVQQESKDEDFRISIIGSPLHTIETTTGDVDERFNIRNESEMSLEIKTNFTDDSVMSTSLMGSSPNMTFESDTDHRWEVAPLSSISVQQQPTIKTTTISSSHPNYYKSCLRRQNEQQHIPTLHLSRIPETILGQQTSPRSSSIIVPVSPPSSIHTQLSTTSQQLFIDDEEFNETPPSSPRVKNSILIKRKSNESYDSSPQSYMTNLDKHIESSQSEQKRSPPSATFDTTSDMPTNSSSNTHYHQHHHHHHVQMFNIQNSSINISTEENNLQSVVNLNTSSSQEQTTTEQSSTNNNYEWNKQEMQNGSFDEQRLQPQSQFNYTQNKRQQRHPYISNYGKYPSSTSQNTNKFMYSNGKKFRKHQSSPMCSGNNKRNDFYHSTRAIPSDRNNTNINDNEQNTIKNEEKIKQINAKSEPLLLQFPSCENNNHQFIKRESEQTIIQDRNEKNSKCGKDLLETELNRQKAKLISIEEKKKQLQQQPSSTLNKKKILTKKSSIIPGIDEVGGKRINISNERTTRLSTSIPLVKSINSDNKLMTRQKHQQQNSLASDTTTTSSTVKSLKSTTTSQSTMSAKNVQSSSTSNIRKRPLSSTQSISTLTTDRKKALLQARISVKQSPQQGLLLCPRSQQDTNENELPKEKEVIKQQKSNINLKVETKRKIKKLIDNEQFDNEKQTEIDNDTLRSSDTLLINSSVTSTNIDSLDEIPPLSSTILIEENNISESCTTDLILDPILYQEMKATQKQWQQYMMQTMEHELHLFNSTKTSSSSSLSSTKHRRKIIATTNDSLYQQSRTKEFYDQYEQLYSFSGFEHWHPNFQYQQTIADISQFD